MRSVVHAEIQLFSLFAFARIMNVIFCHFKNYWGL